MHNPERVTYFAATDARGKKVPFGIKAKDRERHMYIIGKTGMGKSTMLENMAIQDIRNGEGMAFIDPHGSAIDKLLDFIPEDRMKDVVYFAPFDMEQPVAFNVMEDVGYDKRHLVTSGLMATFKKIWVDAWSARMEYILTNTLLALLEYPDATLLGVNRMYTDKSYRKKVVENIKDPVVKDFWVKEFNTYTDRYTQEATPAIQNKIGQFTSNPLIRNIIGQPKSSFDIREMMDNKKILLVNLSKGQVGDVNMKLLGSMITTRLFLGAMSRADLPAAQLAAAPNFYFYVDEFQNFANETFAEILSEARKYHLNLIIAHQYVEQMEEEVAAAVFGNVGTTVTFRVGPFDAEKLEVVFAPEFMPEDLVNLGARQIYLSLMIDGLGSRPFSAVTIPPIDAPPRSFREEVINASRQQFGNPRTGIEEYIFSELALTSDEPPEPPAPKKYPPRAGAAPRPREEERPRRESPPQGERRQDGGERPRPPERSAPPSSARSAEDLKAILRSTLANSEKKKEEKGVVKQETLKNALADVIKKEAPARPSAPPPPQHSRDDRPRPPRQEPERAPRPPQREARPEPKREERGGSFSNDKPVFEVPEEVLRDIFKDTL